MLLLVLLTVALLIGFGGDIGKKVSTDFANGITTDTNTSPNRTLYFDDPISMFDLQAKNVMPSFRQRWDNPAPSYSGLFIKDAVPLHDIGRNPLTISGNDEDAEAITE